MNIQNVLTFTLYQKVLKKHIFDVRALTVSECEILVKKIHDTAILRSITYYEVKLLNEIKVSEAPHFELTHEYEDIINKYEEPK